MLEFSKRVEKQNRLWPGPEPRNSRGNFKTLSAERAELKPVPVREIIHAVTRTIFVAASRQSAAVFQGQITGGALTRRRYSVRALHGWREICILLPLIFLPPSRLPYIALSSCFQRCQA